MRAIIMWRNRCLSGDPYLRMKPALRKQSPPGRSELVWSYLWVLWQLEEACVRLIYRSEATAKSHSSKKGSNLSKILSASLKRNGETFCGQIKVRLFFLGAKVADSLFRRPPNTEFKRLKAMKHGDASWHGALSLTMASGLFITYQGSWINLLVSEYSQRSCFLMLKRKCPWDRCFNKTPTPNISVSEQHLGSRPTKLRLWVMEWPA